MTYLIIFLLFLVLLLLIWVTLRLTGKNQGFDPAVKVVQGVLTAFALLLAGMWYFVERKGMSHSELQMKVTGIHVAEGVALLQLRLLISNIGYTVFRPENWDLRLQSVVPTDLPLEELARYEGTAKGYDQWPARISHRGRSITGRVAYSRQELQWTTLRMFKGSNRHEIEPGERDVRTTEFLLPCTVKVAKLTVAMEKPDRPVLQSLWAWMKGEEPKEWWWKDRAFVTLNDLCAKPVGTKEILHETK